MPHKVFIQAMKEIDDLTQLAEETLAQLHLKAEELKELYRKHEERLTNPAFLAGPSSRQQPRK